MKRNQAMKQAIRLAQKGQGIVFNRPFSSMMLFNGDTLRCSWYEGSSTPLLELLTTNGIPMHGSLVLPYEPDCTQRFMDWILYHQIDTVWIGSLNSDHPKEFVTWARQHNIVVETEIESARALVLNEVHYYNQRMGLPFVTLSFGMSLDGKIATKTGDSKYISGPESRLFVHKLRHRYQAILVGINTIQIDHPHLTTRLPHQLGKDAHRIILDSTLKISLNEPVITQTSPAQTILVTRKDSDSVKKKALLAKGVRIIEIDDPTQPLNLHEMLLKVKAQGIDSILVEGGSTIHFSFIESRLFQRMFASISPLIIGGDSAKSAVGGVGFETLRQAAKLQFVQLHKAGKDLIIEAIPE